VLGRGWESSSKFFGVIANERPVIQTLEEQKRFQILLETRTGQREKCQILEMREANLKDFLHEN
jgi:hypothetical protein